jgi:hypothetical protein
MEDKFYKDEFEQFLQEQANDHRMYPADGVWRNIYKQIHGDRNWPALTVAAFTLLVATLAICVYFSPKPNIFSTDTANLTGTERKSSTNQPKSDLSSTTGFLSTNDKELAQNNNWKPSVKPNRVSTETAIDETQASSSNTNISEVVVAPEKASSPVASTYHVVINAGPRSKHSAIKQIENYEKDLSASTALEDLIDKNEGRSSIVVHAPAKVPKQPLRSTIKLEDDHKSIVDEYLKEHENEVAISSRKNKKAGKSRFTYQVYAAPSFSYRKLDEDRSYLKNNSGGPVAVNYVADVHQIVRHKPGTGIEAGFAFMYAISPKLRVKTGLQFNVRQYNIQAYYGSSELATIALITAGGIDSINTYSFYRTTSGFKPTDITNRFYQVSIPVGIDYEVLGNDNIQLNVAASIQPTYLLNRDVYIISSNFKNYTENKGMLNTWNINSSLEAYLSFKLGDMKLQLGPQFRYQHLPTMISQYPIKEHLMDYGVKIGISKPLF